MCKSEIKESVIKEIKQMKEGIGEITEKTLIGEIQLSSIEFIELILFIEEKLQKEIDIQDLIMENYKDIGSLVKVVDKYV